MSKDNPCISEFREKVKDLLGPKETDAFLDQLKSILEKRSDQSGKTLSDLLNKFAKRVKNEQERKAIINARNRLININLFHDNMNRIRRFKDLANGMRSLLVGKQAYVKDAMNSVDAVKKANRTAFARRVIQKLKEEDLFTAFADKKNGVELAKEMFEEGASKSADIGKIAKIIKDIYAQQVSMLNDAGADIQILKGFIANTTHNPELLQQTADTWRGRQAIRARAFREFPKDAQKRKEFINAVAFLKWQNFITPLINIEASFRGVDVDLKKVWDDLAKGVHLRVNTGDDLLSFKEAGSDDLSARISQHRVIKFKDGEAWAKYNERYGSKNTHLAIMDTLMNGADNLAILRKLGTKPEVMFESLKKRILAESTDPKIRENLSKTEKLFKEVIGQSRQPVHHLGAKIGAALRMSQSLSKLAGVVLTSIPDLANTAALFRSRGDNLFTAWGEVFNNFIPKGPEGRAMNDALGGWAESTFYHLNSHFSPQDSLGGVSARFMQTLFKIVGMDGWDRAMRNGVATSLARRLAQFRDLEFNGLAPGEKRALELYGIDEKEWDLIRENRDAMKQFKNKMYVAPDGVFEYTRESIARYLNKPLDELSDFDIRTVQNDIGERLQTYFIDQTDFANIQPGAADRATLLGSTKPGTWSGELMRMVSQFKYYPVAFTRRIWGRALLGYGDENIVGSLLSGNHDVLGLIETIVSATLLGYISVTLKDLSKGRAPRSPTNGTLFLEALLQGGGLGLYGDFLFGQWEKFGGGLIEAVAGPVPGTLADMAALFASIRDGQGNPKARAFHLLKNNMPYVNLWYTKFLTDYLILYALQERYARGSLQRSVNNLHKEKDQDFLINPLTAVGV